MRSAAASSVLFLLRRFLLSWLEIEAAELARRIVVSAQHRRLRLIFFSLLLSQSLLEALQQFKTFGLSFARRGANTITCWLTTCLHIYNFDPIPCFLFVSSLQRPRPLRRIVFFVAHTAAIVVVPSAAGVNAQTITGLVFGGRAIILRVISSVVFTLVHLYVDYLCLGTRQRALADGLTRSQQFKQLVRVF